MYRVQHFPVGRDTGNIRLKTQNEEAKTKSTTQNNKKITNIDSTKKPGLNPGALKG